MAMIQIVMPLAHITQVICNIVKKCKMGKILKQKYLVIFIARLEQFAPKSLFKTLEKKIRAEFPVYVHVHSMFIF